MPKAETERATLAAQIGADGRALLQALFAPEAPTWWRKVSAVQVLPRVWMQASSAVPSEQPLPWRAGAALPPAAQMINSPYDPEARYSVKRDTTWTGYKVHVTETCDEDAPHLITPVVTTAATPPDWHIAAVLHPALAACDGAGAAGHSLASACGGGIRSGLFHSGLGGTGDDLSPRHGQAQMVRDA